MIREGGWKPKRFPETAVAVAPGCRLVVRAVAWDRRLAVGAVTWDRRLAVGAVALRFYGAKSGRVQLDDPSRRWQCHHQGPDQTPRCISVDA